MGKTLITPVLLKQLRRDAKRLQREKSIPLHEAQSLLAIQYGFKNWSLLVHSSTPASRTEQFLASVTKPLAEGETPAGPQRYYLHGDYSEVMLRKCYCAQCDRFVQPNHFVPQHGPETLERYLADKLAWDNWKTYPETPWRREEDALNALTVAAEVYVAEKERQRSSFHRWLDEQLDRDDPVGDIARDVLSDERFPTAEKTLEGMIQYLQLRRAAPEAIEALKEAFVEYELC